MTENKTQTHNDIGGVALGSVPQDFVERVALATERMKVEGIEIWRPDVSEELEEIFKVVVSGSSVGCNNQQCNHNSHDPASPYIKLIPKSGKLVYLGELEQGENTFNYYALFQNNTTLYFQVVRELFYWDRIYQIEPIGVPEVLLAQFGDKDE